MHVTLSDRKPNNATTRFAALNHTTTTTENQGALQSKFESTALNIASSNPTLDQNEQSMATTRALGTMVYVTWYASHLNGIQHIYVVNVSSRSSTKPSTTGQHHTITRKARSSLAVAPRGVPAQKVHRQSGVQAAYVPCVSSEIRAARGARAMSLGHQ
jgi:hypothetical protein